MTLQVLRVGQTDYQAYASVADADEYLLVDPVLGGAWQELVEDTAQGSTNKQKSIRLIHATRRLDKFNFAGTPLENQTTHFPIDERGVPDAIAKAAIILAALPLPAAPSSNPRQVRREEVDDAFEIEYFYTNASPERINHPEIISLIRPYLKPVNEAHGFGGETVFDKESRGEFWW